LLNWPPNSRLGRTNAPPDDEASKKKYVESLERISIEGIGEVIPSELSAAATRLQVFIGM
jgi:hypothetical protein